MATYHDHQDKEKLREIKEFIAGGPDKFKAVLQLLADAAHEAFEKAARANDNDLRGFCEIAFPALMLWRPKGAGERAMRRMAVTNLPARACYKTLRFDSPAQCEAVRKAWDAFQKEFAP